MGERSPSVRLTGRRSRTDRRAVPSAAAFYVSEVPTLPDATSRFDTYAGDLPARETGSGSEEAHLYFMLHKAKHKADKRRLLLWLNGGPGCSSFDGVMMEVGPWRTRSDGKGLEWVQEGGAWNEYVDVLYLDQPVGTGFSFAPTNAYAKSLKQAGQEVRYFLERFLEVFPEYRKGRGAETWISGESFAGQYIPYTARELLDDSQGELPLDLRGIAIGNGFIDPRSQYGSSIDLLVERNVWKTGGKEHTTAMEAFAKCQEMMKKTEGNPRSIPVCETLLNRVVDLTTQVVGGQKMCINIYDVRLADTAPACGMNWPPNLHATYDYLHREDVRRAFNVNTKQKPEAWIECNPRVSSAISASNEEASITLLPALLEKGLQVLIFAGDQDLICNHIGLERMVSNLHWQGARGFSTTATAQEWSVNNTHAGTWQTDRNLTYVSVAGASHMVGFDMPVASHDMMIRFMNVDMRSAAGASARVPSRVGGEPNRQFLTPADAGSGTGATLSQEDIATAAKWEAYYRAGSVSLVVLLVMLGVGICLWLRERRSRSHVRLKNHSPADESTMELDPLVSNRDPEDVQDPQRRRSEERQFVIAT